MGGRPGEGEEQAEGVKTYTVLFALAFLVSLVGTPLLRRLWFRWGFLDSAIAAGPHERRPVPRLGGVVIYFSLLGTLLALFFPSNVITEEFRNHLPILWLLCGPATLILLVGVADDIWGMKAWLKFSAQVAAALWLVSEGVRISHLSLPWGEAAELGWLSAGVTVLWLVALTNAFNLIDGLDGLAAGVGFLSASAIAVTAIMIDDKMVVVISVVLAGALLGFLRHNFSPATIFLGDSGSMFVGFVLAASAVVWHQKTTTAIAVVAPLVAFALPLADTTVTVVRRTLRGQPWFVSDRHHIHHRLLTLGLAPRRVLLLLYGVSALAALGCILIARGHNLVTGLVLLLFMGAFWTGVRRLEYPEFVEIGRMFSPQRMRARLRLLENADQLRSAPTGGEFWEQLQASAASLGLERVELDLAPEQWARLQVSPGGRGPLTGSGDRLWLLRVPLQAGGTLVLGRDPQRASSGLSLESVAEELRSVVEQMLARLETPTPATSTPIASSQPAPRWASPEKEVV